MNCNQVFTILTRGPFPTGETWDEEVEAHLETCDDCWHLAEALRPAMEVFQEAVPPSETSDLPGYWGDARPSNDMQPVATRTAVATRVRLFTRPYQTHLPYQTETGFSVVLARTIALASSLTVAAVGLLLWWQG